MSKCPIKRKTDNLAVKRKLENFTGDLLTPEEKQFRLKRLQKEIESKRIDEEMVPYVKRINALSSFVTTQCCFGHKGNDHNQRAYIDFRSSLKPGEVIEQILKPMLLKHNVLQVQLFGLWNDRLRYCIRLESKFWKEEMETLINILEGIEYGK